MAWVSIDLPNVRYKLLPGELKDWLTNMVGPITAPPPCDNYGVEWRLKFITTNRDRSTERYVFEFDNDNHAMMFKLAWGGV